MHSDTIEDIPGYKKILKSVLKGQIQQLIEQLSAETGEDSVLLTTSVIDGPVSLTGSKSGKAFLQQHADVQAEFSEFCGKYDRTERPDSPMLDVEGVSADEEDQGEPTNRRHMPHNSKEPGIKEVVNSQQKKSNTISKTSEGSSKITNTRATTMVDSNTSLNLLDSVPNAATKAAITLSLNPLTSLQKNIATTTAANTASLNPIVRIPMTIALSIAANKASLNPLISLPKSIATTIAANTASLNHIVRIPKTIAATTAGNTVSLNPLVSLPKTIALTTAANKASLNPIVRVPKTNAASVAANTASFNAVASLPKIIVVTTAPNTPSFNPVASLRKTITVTTAANTASFNPVASLRKTITVTTAANKASFNSVASLRKTITVTTAPNTASFNPVDSLRKTITVTTAANTASFNPVASLPKTNALTTTPKTPSLQPVVSILKVKTDGALIVKPAASDVSDNAVKISDELRDKSLSDSRPDPGHDETDFLGQCISHLINKNEKALESVPATANRNSDLESAFNALCSDITNHNDDKGKADTSREVNIVDIVLDYIKKEQVEESYTEGVFTEIKQEPVDFEQDNLEQGGADVMEKRSMKAQGQSSSEGRRSGDGKGQSFGEDQGQMLDPPSCSEDESDTDENTQNDAVLPPLNNTNITAAGGPNLQCTVCRKRFFSGSGLRRHCLNKHNLSNRELVLRPHPKDVKTDWVLPPHKNTSTVAGAGSKIQCTVCKKRFFSGSGLRRHCLNKHNNLSNSKCDPHPRDVKTNLVLPSHKNTVTGSKLYCKICKKRFFSLSGLRRHRQNKHNNLRDREPPVPDTKHNVKLHSIKDEVMTQKKHLNTEYNQCEKCGIRFSSKSNLRRHRLNKHNLIILNRSESVELPKPNVKSHGKLYLSKDEEETYKKSHSNLVTIVTESPVAMERESSVTIVTESQVAMERESSVTMVTGGHQCEHCGKCFRKKNNLTRHIKIHMGLQFRCKYCSRTYSSSSSLCKHKRSHRKAADSLMCSYCEYTCFRSDIMKEHIEGVHEKIRKYRCEICSKDFVYRSEFYKHKAKHHVMLPSAKF